MTLHPASARQIAAADPAASTWLSANAGSGKTRVLTDRVARLLLEGTEPQHILCLTYTKAAASEMQNRLFQRLGAWAMLDEATLRDELAALGVAADAGLIAQARRLFARAIETPGGLKIQTIHSFCAGLLRRFPLEAGISPDFAEMDDRSAAKMRADIVERMAEGEDPGAVDALAGLTTGEGLPKILDVICRNSDAFADHLSRDTALAAFDLPTGFGPGHLVSEVWIGGEDALIADLLPILHAGKTNDVKAAEKLADAGTPGLSALAALEDVFIFKSGARAETARIGDFPGKPLRIGPAAGLMEALEALMRRVEAARPRRLALSAAERMVALHRFAGAFLPRYRAEKARMGWLDFDDLIARAAALLSDRSVAQWVLWRLDGGIDHILVDEAQDTSPGQWRVIERLQEEFTAGEGAGKAGRTLFVVGDKKQSIYSFQGADLSVFDDTQGRFQRNYEGAGLPMQALQLEYSFRSSEAVLRVVDRTFEGREAQGIGGAVLHRSFFDSRPGRVDLWPLTGKADAEEPGDWTLPVDFLPDTHHTIRLAARIAGWIAATLAAGTQIETRHGVRPIHAGDFLILVRGRQELFQRIIAACKARGLPIAGADRLKLGEELAVRDIRALLAFLATPEDDLSLAAALRSPLFGWTEAALYDLAQPRAPGSYLWTALRQREDHAETRAILDDLRDKADYLRPFELIDRLLTRHGGRRRLIGRLGAEAEDGIDELLSQSLAYESGAVPSLTGFLVWLDSGDTEVRRQTDAGGRAIRVMTVHGAKGLEAPVVILPDTLRSEPRPGDSILRLADGNVAWAGTVPEAPPALAEARQRLKGRQTEEQERLLYVAMTRAESWLVICGAGDAERGDDTWYGLAAAGMDRAGTEAVDTGQGEFLRHSHGIWPDPAPVSPPPLAAAPADLPAWAGVPAPAAAAEPVALSPSGLGGAKALSGEAEDPADREAAMARGKALHLLLEHLPGWPAGAASEMARMLLTTGGDALDPAETEPLLAEARAVLSASELAPPPGAVTLSEVEVSARPAALGGRLIRGAIDRLVVEPDRVLAIDYKSNAVVPATPAEVPDGILRQMGAYAAMLAGIYPGRRIDTAIFWTRTGLYMPLAPEMVSAALGATPIP